jgi:hypothetical protein
MKVSYDTYLETYGIMTVRTKEAQLHGDRIIKYAISR